MHALTSLNRIPEYAERYRGKVKLVYIDPPFNTGQAFEHYDDGVEHSVWLGMMRERLVQIRDLLSPDGSVWVHLDDAEMAYCKVLMDEIFGRKNFVATVVWEKADSPRNSARFLSVDQDYILIYAREAERWKPNKLGRDDAVNAKYKNPDNDLRGPWLSGDLRANKPYSLGRYEVTGPTGRKFTPPPGKFWRISQETFDALDADSRIWWGPNGEALPTLKRFLSEVGDLVPRTMWAALEVGSNRTSSNEQKRLVPGMEAFSTPKPERLLERVIHIASNPGDIVLDCFGGSGTTAAVAHKMGRRWVTVELSERTVDTFIRARLQKVIAGEDPGGITKSVEWQGGGGFTELCVDQRVYGLTEIAGLEFITIVRGTEQRTLAASVAAQLGYEFDADSIDSGNPLCGRRGRSRLAVINGTFETWHVEPILAALEPGETVLVAATTVADEAREQLARYARGSRVLAVPRELFPKGGMIR